jgi:hypothetical protein
MQPPIPVPDPASASFTAVNDARAFDPFDPIALHWTAMATPEERAAALAKFRLGLSYTATGPTTLYAPASGFVFFRVRRDGDQLLSRTLILELEKDTAAALHLMGREEDEPEPTDLSALPRDGPSAPDIQVRLLFTVTTEALSDRLRTQLLALFADGRGVLQRLFPVRYDLRAQGDQLVPVDIAPTPAEQMLFDPWWKTQSGVCWKLTGSDDQRRLLDLQPGDVVLVQAEMREGLPRSATDHWYLVNPGWLLRSLGVCGDPATAANDAAYRAVSGGCVRRVSSGGTFESGGTNPAGAAPLGFDDVVVVHGGSQGSVLLQPPGDGTVAGGCVFSFTTAEDITIFSPRLQDQPMGVRVWQPTFSALDIELVRLHANEFHAKPSEVYSPPVGTAILATEYHTPGHATRYPGKTSDRDAFLRIMADSYGYHETRARPPAASPPYALPALTSWEQKINLNERSEVRPEHPRWRRKSSGQIFPTLRRLYPLRLELRGGAAADSALLAILTQDEIDCVRQEYAFHLRWTGDYYQDYQVVWGTATERAAKIHETPNHRIGVNAAARPVPALEESHRFRVPRRLEIRPITKTETHYRYTRLTPNWRDRIKEARDAAAPFAQRVRELLGDPAELARIRAARDATNPRQNYVDPRGVLPAYAAEIVATVQELVSEPGDRDPTKTAPDGFLQWALRGQKALQRFADLDPYELSIGSAWRPPEHNESPSKTPISNHQLGEAFDKKPRGTGDGVRNPLAIMCLHLAGQALRNRDRLREMLLENQSAEYLSREVDNDRRWWVVRAIFQVDGSAIYAMRDPDSGLEDLVPNISLPVEEDEVQLPVGSRVLASRLADDFREAYGEYRGQFGNLWPTPLPAYRDIYTFALTIASHVHFTWNPPF